MAQLTEFLQRPLFKLNGFQVTVFVVVLLALAFMAYRKWK